eukprot:529663-Lingulodinium_polyedra.AAC.1
MISEPLLRLLRAGLRCTALGASASGMAVNPRGRAALHRRPTVWPRPRTTTANSPARSNLARPPFR